MKPASGVYRVKATVTTEVRYITGRCANMKWLGHAAFSLVSPAGVRIVTDPFASSVPYPPISLDCDVVTVSHEHHDHNGIDGLKGSPRVLRGLSGKEVAQVDETIGDVRFRTVASFHDGEGGSKRGANAVFVMEMPGMTVVHLGDLGHELDAKAVAAIGKCDVLLVPVGGHYTIDGKTAARVVRALNPRVAVAMHFKTGYIADWPIAGPEEFAAQWSSVKRLPAGEFSVELSPDGPRGDTEVWIPAI
ncbi:MAG TPA: MBL fold metallo-hydrolase [Firmicutes bacterium]|nr:MBL fold metallo-hydrolase [Candidatus Fermentithermobacillaceae bacterium]